MDWSASSDPQSRTTSRWQENLSEVRRPLEYDLNPRSFEVTMLWTGIHDFGNGFILKFLKLFLGNISSLTFGQTVHRKKTNCQIRTMTLNATLYKKYLWCLLLLHIKSDCKILICIFWWVDKGYKSTVRERSNCTLRNATVCENHFRIQCRFKDACNFFPV